MSVSESLHSYQAVANIFWVLSNAETFSWLIDFSNTETLHQLFIIIIILGFILFVIHPKHTKHYRICFFPLIIVKPISVGQTKQVIWTLTQLLDIFHILLRPN